MQDRLCKIVYERLMDD